MTSDPKARVEGAIVQAKAALERALADLDHVPIADPGMTAFMAHALNNFLSVSIATIDILRETLDNPPDHECWRLIDSLEHSARLMTTGVARLQGEAGEVRLRRVPVLMAMLLDRALLYYGPDASAKSLALVLDTPDGLPHVWTDGIAVGAVIDNLLSNAVKFSPRGARVTLRLVPDGDGIVCEVIDEGPGLSEADQAHLFEEPGRLTARPTGGESSHGHGLVVAGVLVRRLGGTIGCRSTPGHGATFWFRLPIAGAATPPLARS
jgi:signal transduction histidine kinase